MLYGYPMEATGENWLHDCLHEILQSIHFSLKAGNTPQPWPDVIPVLYYDKLYRRTGLRDRLNIYIRVLKRLNAANRERVFKALNDQNQIGSLLSGVCECESIYDLPQRIRAPVTELFRFAFKLLTELGIRDRHYDLIYRSREDHICPFCGCEYFDSPGAPREALDHYLGESKYPFAAANLQNLAPMGDKCNSKYKLAQDILWSDAGVRRRSFNPYSNINIRISLDNSQPFAGTDGILPKWEIEFEPSTEEVHTWENVFHIRQRYSMYHLDPYFNSWLREFASLCHATRVAHDSDQELVAALRIWADHLEKQGIQDRAFLKSAVFRMLYNQCERGNQRIIKLVRRVLVGVIA